MRTTTRSGLAVLMFTAAGCSSTGSKDTSDYQGPTLPWAYTDFPEVPVPHDNPITGEKVELGRFLFYDPVLSSDGKVACVTCHSAEWGMADGLSLSVGVDGTGAIGPGRTGPNMTTRNSMTLWNAAFRPALFWDGRSPTLEAQAVEPLKKATEMNMPPDQAAAKVGAIPEYVDLFARAFPEEPITAETIAKAIATFERTIVTRHAPYDEYVGGDTGAMAPEEIHGMQLFARAGCAECHAPPLFESSRYVRRFDSEDDGRYSVTNVDADRGAFRVPTLRNARETGPYFHDGSVASLRDAVADEVLRDVDAGGVSALSDPDVDDLTAFIANALMDRTENPAAPDHVPSGLPMPADGLRIPR
jgi:cytochrome c peroxidase